MSRTPHLRRLAAWFLVGSAVGIAAGCRDAPPAAAPEPPGGLRSGSLEWQGRTRTFLWHRGRAAADGPAPLLVVLHGSGGSGAEMAAVSGFDTLADRTGCVVAFPDGVARTWADGRGTTPSERAGVDDVGFVRRLVGHLKADTAVNPSQVYAAGYSNGGMMVQRLALEAPDLLAAGASVGAGLPERLAARRPARPVPPLLLIHGTEDPVSPGSVARSTARTAAGCSRRPRRRGGGPGRTGPIRHRCPWSYRTGMTTAPGADGDLPRERRDRSAGDPGRGGGRRPRLAGRTGAAPGLAARPGHAGTGRRSVHLGIPAPIPPAGQQPTDSIPAESIPPEEKRRKNEQKMGVDSSTISEYTRIS